MHTTTATPTSRVTRGDVFDERASLLGAPAYFGPPVIFVLGPWLLLVLMLAGPVALALTIVLALAACAIVLAACAAVIASPYVLVRHLRGHRIAFAKPVADLHLIRAYRVATRRLGSTQAKGIS
jgi:hypothetical protein